MWRAFIGTFHPLLRFTLAGPRPHCAVPPCACVPWCGSFCAVRPFMRVSRVGGSFCVWHLVCPFLVVSLVLWPLSACAMLLTGPRRHYG